MTDGEEKQLWILDLTHAGGQVTVMTAPRIRAAGSSYSSVTFSVQEAIVTFDRFEAWNRTGYEDLIAAIKEGRNFGMDVETTANELERIGLLTQER